MEFNELRKENINSIEPRKTFRFHNTDLKQNSGETDKIKSKVRKKCGEIFIDEDNLLDFLCTLCESPFEEIGKFLVHVKDVHNNEDEYITIKQENLLRPTDDEFSDLKHEPNVQIMAIDDIEVNLPEYGEGTADSLDTYSNENSNEHEDESEDKDDFNDQDNTFTNEKFVKRCRIKPVCETCGKLFANLRNLKRHREEVKCWDKLTKSTVCQICGKNLSSIKSLRRHQNTTCRQDNKIDTAKKTDNDLSNKNDGSKKCRYCNRYLADSSRRVEHERIHTGEKPFQCQICGKCFRTLANCTAHEQHHTTERLFKCEVCNLAFKSKRTLYTHNQRHGEKIFPCSYCEKSFYQRSERKQHERFHTGEKPYKCTTCGRAFQTSGSLQDHKRRHLNIRPHKCEYCGNCFFTKAMLRNHIVIHTGERPFVCTICNATFPRRKGLKSHEKIHSDLPKYVCTTLDKPKYTGIV